MIEKTKGTLTTEGFSCFTGRLLIKRGRSRSWLLHWEGRGQKQRRKARAERMLAGVGPKKNQGKDNSRCRGARPSSPRRVQLVSVTLGEGATQQPTMIEAHGDCLFPVASYGLPSVSAAFTTCVGGVRQSAPWAGWLVATVVKFEPSVIQCIQTACLAHGFRAGRNTARHDPC